MFGALEEWVSYVKVSFFIFFFFFLLININVITDFYFPIVRVKCKSIKI